jgi:Ras-related protein Rab-11A
LQSGTFKICIFGDGGVGKTTLIQKYVSGFFKESTKMTIGLDIATKVIEVKDWSIKLQLWDFGGEERFRFFLPAYARGSFAGIFVYDITRYASLRNFDLWLNTFKKGVDFENNPIPLLMVGAKLDLEDIRSIPIEEALDFAQLKNIFNVIECSSKTGENVERAFELITLQILKHKGFI